MPQKWKGVIDGPPGDVFVNGTGKTLYQWRCSFANSCGRCVEMANRIGKWWPLPLHRGCTCRNAPVHPGQAAEPFLDYREEVAKLDPDQKRRVIGAANLRLVEAGLVDWSDVVDRTRIKALREVVAERKLTVDQMARAGVARWDAEEAFDAVHTPAHALAAQRRKDLVEKLKAGGLTPDQIRDAFGRRVAGKVGIGGPSGGQNPPLPPIAPPPPPPPPPVPAKPKRPRPWPKDPIGDVEVVRTLGGSTGAELVRDKLTGREFVRKRGASPEHLREEAAADRLYAALGLKVPKSKLFEVKGGGPVKLARYVEGRTLAELRASDPAAAAKAEAELRRGFVADALLGNWDVVGLSADNVLVDAKGGVHRIDNGGALRFRAQGKRKSAAQWSGSVDELATLRDPAVNPAAASVFGKLTDEEVAKQVDRLLARRRKVLDAAPADLKSTLSARLDFMEKWAERARAAAAKAAAPVGGWTPSPASDFRTFKDFEEARKWAEAAFAPAASGMDQRDKSAFLRYSGSDYRELNAYLRSGAKKPDPGLDRFAADLDAAFAKAALPEGAVVWRGTDLRSAGFDRASLAPGQVIPDRGYTSTTIKKGSAFGGDKLEVRLPKGTPCYYLNASQSSKFAREHEVLVDRKVDQFRVVEVLPDRIVVEAVL